VSVRGTEERKAHGLVEGSHSSSISFR